MLDDVHRCNGNSGCCSGVKGCLDEGNEFDLDSSNGGNTPMVPKNSASTSSSQEGSASSGDVPIQLRVEGFTDNIQSLTVTYPTRGLLDVKDLRPLELLVYIEDLYAHEKDTPKRAMLVKEHLQSFIEMYKLAAQVIGTAMNPNITKTYTKATVNTILEAKSEKEIKKVNEELVFSF